MHEHKENKNLSNNQRLNPHQIGVKDKHSPPLSFAQGYNNAYQTQTNGFGNNKNNNNLRRPSPMKSNNSMTTDSHRKFK